MKLFDEVVLIRIDKYDKRWLKAEARKKRLSVAGLIRHWINYFRNGKDKNTN